MTKQFELWFPFSPEVAGMTDEEVPIVHNQPFAEILSSINHFGNWRCSQVYITQKKNSYTLTGPNVDCHFYPLSFRRRALSYRYPSQWSIQALKHLLFNPPSAVGFFAASGRFPKIAAMICYLRRIPYVIIVGGWYEQINQSQLRYFSQADYVLVHTQMQKDALIKIGYSEHNIEVFPIGVNIKRFYPKTSANHVSRTNNSLHLLYVGRLTWAKGAIEAVHAFSAIHEHHPYAILSIAGSLGNKDYVDQLKGVIQRYNLQNVINLLGPIPHEALPQLYHNADVLLFPSIYEGLPQVVLESMSCGTPAITVQGIGGTPEIINHGVNGWIVEMPRLAYELLKLLEEPEQFRSIGLNARQTIYDNYPSERTCTHLTTILNSFN